MARIGVFVGGSPLPIEGKPMSIATDTPWGQASQAPWQIELGQHEYLLLHRHGPEHALNPHQINYRANVWLMNTLGVDALLGTHTVGSLDLALEVGALVLPHQLIDYTWGREQTFDDERRHVDFSNPYTESLRVRLLASNVPMHDGGVYGCTQGPRLEGAAEIVRMGRDGCTLVGMTGMPEAGLARELGLAYASLCVVVNPAAALGPAGIDMAQLRAASQQGADSIWAVLESLN